jgi:hypothetical protein
MGVGEKCGLFLVLLEFLDYGFLLGWGELFVLADGAAEGFDVAQDDAVDLEVDFGFDVGDAAEGAEGGACFEGFVVWVVFGHWNHYFKCEVAKMRCVLRFSWLIYKQVLDNAIFGTENVKNV